MAKKQTSQQPPVQEQLPPVQEESNAAFDSAQAPAETPAPDVVPPADAPEKIETPAFDSAQAPVETPVVPQVVETPKEETPVVPPVVEIPKEETPEERAERRAQKAKEEAAQMLEDSKERGKKEVTTKEPIYRERGN